jgi:hypothetical protein
MPDQQAQPVTFIHKDGHVIPIRPREALRSRITSIKKEAKYLHQEAKYRINRALGKTPIKARLKQKPIKVNQAWNTLGIGLSVASGAVSAATFSKKAFVPGAIASHVLDAFGVAANVAAVKGKGRTMDRTKQAAKQEAFNFALGWGVYGAGLLAFKKNRQNMAALGGKVAQYGKKAFSIMSRF